MALTKTTKQELKRLGLDQLGITDDERTAQFYINHYAAKERATAWQKEAEEANRQAAANWPAELHPGVHGVETASGCEFDIIRIEGTTVTIKVTNRKNGTEQEDDLADFLDRIKHGYVIATDYTPEEMADGIVKPMGEGEIWERSAKNLQSLYDKTKPRFITKPVGEKGEAA